MGASSVQIKGLSQQLKSSCASCSLQQLCLPAGVSKDDLPKLDKIVQRQKPMVKGKTLYRATDKFEKIYVVRTGSVKTYHQGGEGDDQILGFHFPGDVLGLDALNAMQHGCTAECLEHTSVCEFPFENLEEVSEKLPALRHQFLKIISREMVNEHRHLLVLGRKNAQERLAVFLLSLSMRFSQRGYTGDVFNLSMSRYDLANFLGLAVETVSRLFSRLQEEGVLKVERKHVEILDMEALAEAAGSDIDLEGNSKYFCP